jgi:hypothetical protein
VIVIVNRIRLDTALDSTTGDVYRVEACRPWCIMPFIPPSRQACPWSVHWRYSSGFRTISFLPPLTNCPGSFLLCGDSLAPASSYFLLVGLVEAPATTRRLRRVRFCSLATSLCCFHDLKLSQRLAFGQFGLAAPSRF